MEKRTERQISDNSCSEKTEIADNHVGGKLFTGLAVFLDRKESKWFTVGPAPFQKDQQQPSKYVLIERSRILRPLSIG